jgi:outer membrane protein TolC
MKLGLLLIMLSQALTAMQFSDLTILMDNTYTVQNALRTRSIAEAEMAVLAYPGDISLNLEPSSRVLTEEGGSFGSTVSISGSASMGIPLSLSKIDKERVSFAANDVLLADRAVESAREDVYIRLHSLFQKLWLLQNEEPVLQMELEAAEKALQIKQKQFEAGSISLLVLTEAGEIFRNRQDRNNQNILDQNITIFEIRSITGLDLSEESLEKTVLDISELPPPPELFDHVLQNNSLVLMENLKLREMEQTMERVSRLDYDLSVKSTFNSADNGITANIGLDLMDPAITSSINFPVYTFGEEESAGSGSDNTWSLGFAFEIGLGAGKESSLERVSLEQQIIQQKGKLDNIINAVNLDLRSSYQQYKKDLEAIESALQVLERSRTNHKIIETKDTLGQVSEHDLLESEALVRRSEWNVEAVRINAEKSWLSLLSRASWFENSGLKF